MSRPVERIEDINDGKELWKSVVRIHHRWNVVYNNKEHFEMIFVDNIGDYPGDDIHVVVPAPHVSVFTEKCLLGHTYTISNFKVVPYVLAFKASGHKYMPCEINIFFSYVVGMVNSIGYAQTESGAKKQQISMVLRDHSNNMLNCTLWESYADQFIRFNIDRVAASLPIVVLLQYAKVKEEGKYTLFVTNTYNVALLCVDADFPVMKDFIDRMPEESRVTLSDQLGGNSQLSSQNSENQQLTPVQKLLSKAVVLPIAEIIQLKDIRFCATVATTKLLVVSPFGWYYRACHMCQSIARGNNPPFECEAGHEIMAEVFRYKIEIEVTHGCKSCNFVFWNRECEMQDGITDPLDFPLALDQLLKLEMAMKQLKEKWGTNEEPNPIQIVIPETLEDLEITSDHKPDAVTPAGKSHFPGASSESTNLDGLYVGELSSNKLKKIIKMEKID
ncbi:uncharacterized protein LOC131597139 [Vicia villosa]|uniref:uncharacterized protein LOC131597139 n=1 Tax=Vicia villosa TaxID=3911 RepID=UPI00273CBD18|nr:uncharacterized protein LOC131597139 [Vicia villosa]